MYHKILYSEASSLLEMLCNDLLLPIWDMFQMYSHSPKNMSIKSASKTTSVYVVDFWHFIRQNPKIGILPDLYIFDMIPYKQIS